MLGRYIAFCVIAAWIPSAFAAETPKATMDAIKESVMSLCQSPNGDGTYVNVQGEGDAGVSVQILKLIGSAEAKGKASFTKEEWSGIRKVADQASENKDYRACVRELTPKFLDKFIVGDTKKEKQSDATNSIEVNSGVIAVKYARLGNAEFEPTYWASWADKVRVVKSGENKVVATLDCSTGGIYGMDISSSNPPVIAVACLNELRLLNVLTGEGFKFQIGPETSGPGSELLELGLGYVISKHPSDPCLLVWGRFDPTNKANAKLLYRLDCSNVVKSIALHDKYNLLAVGLADGTIELWSLGSSEAEKKFSQKFVHQFSQPYQNNGIEGIEFSSISYEALGFKIAAHAWGNVAYVIDMPNMSQSSVTTIEYPASEHVIYASRLSSDAKRLALGTSDGAVTVWDLASRQPIAKYLHDDEVKSVDFGANNNIVVSTGRDRAVKVFRIDANSVVDTVSLGKESIALRVDNGRRRFVVGQGTRANEAGPFFVGEWRLNPGGKIAPIAD
jgi:WD40 repeat protein